MSFGYIWPTGIGYFTLRIPHQMRTGICLQLERRSRLCCRIPHVHRFRLQLLQCQCKLATFVALHVLLCSRCYELWLYLAHWNWLFYLEDSSSNEDRNLPAAGTQIEAVLPDSACAPLQAPTASVSVQACNLCGPTCAALLQVL